MRWSTCREFCSLRNSCCRITCWFIFCLPLALGAVVLVAGVGCAADVFVLGWSNEVAARDGQPLSDARLLAVYIGEGVVVLAVLAGAILLVVGVTCGLFVCTYDAWRDAEHRARAYERADVEQQCATLSEK